MFSDLEGRLHMLDYDKKFLLSLREPHLRRLVDPRLHRADRERPPPGHRLERLLLGARRRLRHRQGAGVRQRHGQGRHPLLRRPARRAQGLLPRSCFKESIHPERGHRDRRLPLRGQGRRAELPRDRQVRVHLHRRLLPLAAPRSPAPVHRHLGRSAARHGLPE